MEIKYKVHSCVPGEFHVDAQIGGKTVQAKVPGLIIELVSEDGSMSHDFRQMVDDPAAEAAKFTPGTEVTVTLTPGEPAPLVVRPPDPVEE